MAALDDGPIEPRLPFLPEAHRPPTRKRIRRPATRPIQPDVAELLSALDEMRQLDAERRSPATPALRREELDERLAARSRHVFRLASAERRRHQP